MGARRCSVEECARALYARGLCGMHYKRVLRHDDPQPDVSARGTARPQRCAVPSCAHLVEARGWCHGHYLRWVRTGDVNPDKPLTRRTQREFCTVDGCDRRCHSKGACARRTTNAFRPPDRSGPTSRSARSRVTAASATATARSPYHRTNGTCFPATRRRSNTAWSWHGHSDARCIPTRRCITATGSAPTIGWRTWSCGRRRIRRDNSSQTRSSSRSRCYAGIGQSYGAT